VGEKLVSSCGKSALDGIRDGGVKLSRKTRGTGSIGQTGEKKKREKRSKKGKEEGERVHAKGAW